MEKKGLDIKIIAICMAVLYGTSFIINLQSFQYDDNVVRGPTNVSNFFIRLLPLKSYCQRLSRYISMSTYKQISYGRQSTRNPPHNAKRRDLKKLIQYKQTVTCYWSLKTSYNLSSIHNILNSMSWKYFLKASLLKKTIPKSLLPLI